ncbi:predicted protein [Nematostella vectensis]|uniref:Uncharacterized protein n=1 Tax=Nematostella vectensis TaxID=45351 RepID=A7SSJ8_NEMVE|nr:predicted protein [Nematostella vectensis]|eukprot:XP_001625416.1 predicted protein [Nematostella vectensis]
MEPTGDIKQVASRFCLHKHYNCILDAGIPVSVCMIMIDSFSAANFHRKMPKGVDYFKTLPTVFLKANIIVGDGTTAQVTAMVTGIAEVEQLEARRKMANAKPVDECVFCSGTLSL